MLAQLCASTFKVYILANSFCILIMSEKISAQHVAASHNPSRQSNPQVC